MKKNNKGFTLAELLIVVAIIAVLVAIAIPIFTSQLEKAREATDIANIRDYYAEITLRRKGPPPKRDNSTLGKPRDDRKMRRRDPHETKGKWKGGRGSRGDYPFPLVVLISFTVANTRPIRQMDSLGI